MAPTPKMQVAPRRFASPIELFERAKLEPIHQELYSCALYDAAAIPNEVGLFTYALGGTVVGTVTGQSANALHTNMETPSFLANPKLFLVEGLRIHVPPLNTALNAPAEIVTGDPSLGGNWAFFDSLRMLYAATWIRFRVGQKDYLRVPTWLCPPNIGVGGAAGAAIDQLAPAATDTVLAVAPYMSGRVMSFPTAPILIPPQQNFRVDVMRSETRVATLPSAIPVYGILDGIYGRETQ